MMGKTQDVVANKRAKIEKGPIGGKKDGRTVQGYSDVL